MKQAIALPSFNKHNPAPAFLQRPAPAQKLEVKVTAEAPPRRFTPAERDIIAKAWARKVLSNETMAKAQRSDAVAKLATDASKRVADIEADIAKCNHLLEQLEQISVRLDFLEAQKTSGIVRGMPSQ